MTTLLNRPKVKVAKKARSGRGTKISKPPRTISSITKPGALNPKPPGVRTETTPWDGSEYLTSEVEMAAYLNAAFEDGHPKIIAAALGNIARAKGMAQIAREAGLNRESLYKALSEDGNPELSTLLKVLRALGIQLQVTPFPVPAT